MRNGVCPKCGASEIHYTTGPAIEGAVKLTLGLFMATRLVLYICVSCGYVESYVAEQDWLQTIAEKLPRIDHQ